MLPGEARPVVYSAEPGCVPKTGVHSNDAESEVARYKKWHCSKWTSVRTLNTKDQAKKQNHPEGKISCNVLPNNHRECHASGHGNSHVGHRPCWQGSRRGSQNHCGDTGPDMYKSRVCIAEAMKPRNS